MSTRSVLERSPIILRTGEGSFRTRVGIARIWSPRDSFGFSNRSTTCILYRPARCSLQIFLRLAKAATDLGVCPATYRRRTMMSNSGLALDRAGLVGVVFILNFHFFCLLPHPLFGSDPCAHVLAPIQLSLLFPGR